MADVMESDGKTAETGDEKVQTVTREQFDDLQKRLEQITAAQSGSDKKVAELTKALTEERKAKESTAKTAEQRIAELEQKWRAADDAARRADLRARARDLLEASGVRAPKYLDRLIGNDEEETIRNVGLFIEDEKERVAERNKEFDREHGRTVSGPTRDVPSSYDKLLEMSDEELKRMNPKEVAAIINRAVAGS